MYISKKISYIFLTDSSLQFQNISPNNVSQKYRDLGWTYVKICSILWFLVSISRKVADTWKNWPALRPRYSLVPLTRQVFLEDGLPQQFASKSALIVLLIWLMTNNISLLDCRRSFPLTSFGVLAVPFNEQSLQEPIYIFSYRHSFELIKRN